MKEGKPSIPVGRQSQSTAGGHSADAYCSRMTAASVPPTQGKMEYAFELEVSGKVEDVVETLLQVSQPFRGLTHTEHRAD